MTLCFGMQRHRFEAYATAAAGKMSRELAVEMASAHMGYEIALRKHYRTLLDILDEPYAVAQ